MKRLYTTLSILGLYSLAMAQPVIQAIDINPSIGDVYDINVTQWVSEGNAGSNVTWDLSSMTVASANSMTINAGSPSFPLANHTMLDGSGSMMYQENSSTGQYVHGQDAGGVLFTFQDPMKMLAFPLDENVNETDAFAATFTSGVPFTRAGTNDIVADAWGTLITPDDTFNDVWRVRIDQDYTDTYAGGTIVYQAQIYVWYKAGIHYPLASVSTLTTSQGANIDYGTYLNTANLNIIEEVNEAFKLYPNPANENLNVEFESIEAIRIYNAVGNLIKEVSVSSLSNTVSIDIRDLTSGMYFVKGLNNEGTETKGQKVIKQ